MADDVNGQRGAAIASVIDALEGTWKEAAERSIFVCSEACRRTSLSLIETKMQDILILGRELHEPFEGYNYRDVA